MRSAGTDAAIFWMPSRRPPRRNLYLPGGDTHYNRHGNEVAARAAMKCIQATTHWAVAPVENRLCFRSRCDSPSADSAAGGGILTKNSIAIEGIVVYKMTSSFPTCGNQRVHCVPRGSRAGHPRRVGFAAREVVQVRSS